MDAFYISVNRNGTHVSALVYWFKTICIVYSNARNSKKKYVLHYIRFQTCWNDTDRVRFVPAIQVFIYSFIRVYYRWWFPFIFSSVQLRTVQKFDSVAYNQIVENSPGGIPHKVYFNKGLWWRIIAYNYF